MILFLYSQAKRFSITLSDWFVFFPALCDTRGNPRGDLLCWMFASESSTHVPPGTDSRGLFGRKEVQVSFLKMNETVEDPSLTWWCKIISSVLNLDFIWTTCWWDSRMFCCPSWLFEVVDSLRISLSPLWRPSPAPFGCVRWNCGQQWCFKHSILGYQSFLYYFLKGWLLKLCSAGVQARLLFQSVGCLLSHLLVLEQLLWSIRLLTGFLLNSAACV